MKEYYSLLYSGHYNRLIEETLPLLSTDEDARRAFLRLFLQREPIVLLNDESVDILSEEAENGNPYAQYAYARWQCIVRGGENSLNISYQMMQSAAEKNIPDAIAGYAITYDFGDMGYVDWTKYSALLEQSIEMGSELGKLYRLRELCFGNHFHPAQPEQAVALADTYIAADAAKGIEPNGMWFYYRALANEARMGRTRVIDDYKKALENGIMAAFADLIIAYGYGDDTTTLVETKEYTDYLLQGIARLSAGALYLDAAREIRRYETLDALFDDTEQAYGKQYEILHESHENIFSRLSQAARLGDVSAWELLGDCYYNGSLGFQQDYEKAFSAYSNGVIHDSLSCTEKLWEMMHDHIIDRPLHYIDEIALKGARLGSKRLLAETVIAHQEGRLNEFADEIERYYEPIFDAPEFSIDIDDDETPMYDDRLAEIDDDGRYDAFV